MNGVLILGGATGSGKNAAALEVAARVPAEIINADSRQIYRELSIGTNQPALEQLSAVPHHLFAFLAPSEQYSVADYERSAVPVISQILKAGRLPIIVGGTGFYIKAVLKGLWPVPARDPALRSRLQDIREHKGAGHLHSLLKKLDSVSAEKIPANDSYRVIRALEIRLQTGVPRSKIQQPTEDRFPSWKFYLDLPPAVLESRIAARTEQMFAAGWVDEVRELLLKYPDFKSYPAARSLGYPEILQHLAGQLSLEECQKVVLRKTLQYAKRQRTWFRNQDRFERVGSLEELHKKLESVLQ